MTILHESLHWAHPLVQEWFYQRFGIPTEPQQQGWPLIVNQQSTLISAPTGSGKTLAAFLVCINDLVTKALDHSLLAQTEVVYVSPLKALSNDVHKNLIEPLSEIMALAQQRGLPFIEIKAAVRTGDTLMKDRQAMIKKPPHILVTTPESLYILLTAEKSRHMLSRVKTVIVDEIHALADDKRGAHLTLSLERLEALTQTPLLRIGLSATQKPIELVGQFLVGQQRPLPAILHIGHARHLDIGIEVPNSELGAVASNEMWEEIYDRIAVLAEQHRSTLVFVNTRRLAERVAHHLAERLGKDKVATHHGSLSRKLRLAAETKLKQGELKLLVATASLELGIDIGSIDLVCQIGSPHSIAVALQRVGRAGHWHGAISKGRFFVTTRDDLAECAALVYAIRSGDLDRLIIPEQPLDILAQQLVATCATGDWTENDLYRLVTNAFPYRNLSRQTFDEVIRILAEGIAGSRGRYGAYLLHDQVNHLLKGRRGIRLTAILNGGAIPDNNLFSVITQPQEAIVGTLDEDFAVESNRGDIILLGSTSWQVKRIESNAGKVWVEDAHGAPPSVPFWQGEAPGRTDELSYQVSALRQRLSDFLTSESFEKSATIHWLTENTGMDESAADQLITYFMQGKAILGAIPTQQCVIAERFFDEAGGMQLIIHAPFGSRINKAWGLALRKRFCRSFNFELQATATNDGLHIALAEQHSFPLADVFQFLHPNTLKDVLTQAVLQSPLFNTRWRWDATRALALLKFRNGKKIPPNVLRMLADDLLAAVFPDAAACQDNLGGRDIEIPDHPLIRETLKDALTEALDIEGLMTVIRQILSSDIHCLAVDSPLPSPFSHEILNANPYAFLDDAPLEERRARAVEMRQVLPESILKEIGKLDPTAIQEVKEQAWPDIRNADELHDTLQTFIAYPLDETVNQYISPLPWQIFLPELLQSGRVGLARIAGRLFGYAAEKAQTFLSIYPDATIEQAPVAIAETHQSREMALIAMLRGWVQSLGPTTQAELSALLALEANDVETALLHLEHTGLLLRGHFKFNDDRIEWCERRLLARIHRLTLGRLRKEIEPVTAAQFMQWLFTWQHITPETQLRDEQGLLEVIQQLQGFEIPASAWETQIFPKRVTHYDPDMLDRLCLSGTIGWGRFSMHPALNADIETNKSILPTRNTPITFFVRNDTFEFVSSDTKESLLALSHVAKAIYDYLTQYGASFFPDIVRGIQHLKTEVETGLWELVAAGKITADSFDNLRALIQLNRHKKRRRHREIRYATARWSILPNTASSTPAIEAICRQLLKRYGVVFRDLILREKNLPRWRELLLTFRRMEDRGEIRGGRFVSGFLGEQFALPYAVESLRIYKKKPLTQMTITLSAIDPLNLVGLILPGPKIPASPRKTIQFQNGECVSERPF